MTSELPIDSILPEIAALVSQQSSLVLKAPPGAGKTTRVPPTLAELKELQDGMIVVLEPRRIAARSAARRTSHEAGKPLGEWAGYRVRFEDRTTESTRILFATEGVLIRMLQSNPLLEGIAAVVFDEFHERHLDADLALAMVRRVQATLRPELRIVVMSATLEPEPIVAFLGGCPAIESPGRSYPVETRYSKSLPRDAIEDQVFKAVERTLRIDDGDVLVFLPGVGEIRRVERKLANLDRLEPISVMPLYGDLSSEQQDAVLAPQPRRKIVLATNVAETSITIDGIKTVIDSGLARVLQFDAATGLNRLEVGKISIASADQRTGRAGRTGPGKCVRLWDEVSHRHRAEHETPEIQRVDLAGAVLQLYDWGETDLDNFPWFESPTNEALQHAIRLLERLSAIEGNRLTDLGRQMARIPLQPRLARLVIEGQQAGIGPRTTRLAALLSERDPFRISVDPTRDRSRQRDWTQRSRRSSASDLLDRLVALERFEFEGLTKTPWGPINVGAAKNVLRIASQLQRVVDREVEFPDEVFGDEDEWVQRALLAAYPDRVSRRREPGGKRAIMVGGKGVKLGDQSAVQDAEFFVGVDLDGRSSEPVVRMASGVDPSWLDIHRFHRRTEVFFHPTRKEVQARQRNYWDDLILSETPTNECDLTERAELLATQAKKNWPQVFPSKDEELALLIARSTNLKLWAPELDLPCLDEAMLHEILEELCFQYRSFQQLKQAEWTRAARARFDYQQMQKLDEHAPVRIKVPSGREIKLTYEQGRPPILAAKIQDLFGLQETPRIANGRVPVLIHLLAPNMRPQQVTDDLASFWANTYQVVRKELRGRYPKHAWPEDPLA